MEPDGSALERLARELGAFLPRNDSAATININAGGIGVWVATCACLIMVTAVLVLVPVFVGAYREQQDEIRALRDSDNAIRAYINTGILKPVEEQEDAD